jgi:hypothetical protein
VNIVFLDIDGPLIPNRLILVNKMASWHRQFDPVSVAVLDKFCQTVGAKIVFNTTHNRDEIPFMEAGVPPIEVALRNTGFATEYHEDLKTIYPTLSRYESVHLWLKRHPDVTQWIAFDDVNFTDEPNLILVDADVGISLQNYNAGLALFGKEPEVIW